MKKLRLKAEVVRALRGHQLTDAKGGLGQSQSVQIPFNCYASCVPWDCQVSGLCTLP